MAAIKAFDKANGIDLISFDTGEYKDDRVLAPGGDGVLYVGKAQEKAPGAAHPMMLEVMRMSSNRNAGPKDSEICVGDWLKEIGAENLQYLGSKDQEGPPDWVIRYEGEEVAVEVSLLHDPAGWGRSSEVFAFQHELEKLIEEESVRTATAPQWHARCEYDPRESKSSIRNQEEWKSRARRALSTPGPGGSFQLLSSAATKGRGVILELTPASSTGSFAGVSVDEGFIVEPTLTKRIIAETRKKTDKVRKGDRAKNYRRWWLVFDDEILIAPIWALTASEQSNIATAVQNSIDRKLWSKIVLVSRFQAAPNSQGHPKWFWAPWEDDRHPPLPRSQTEG